jgi:hypothetical protein
MTMAMMYGKKRKGEIKLGGKVNAESRDLNSDKREK